MIVSVVFGASGCLVALFALKCLKMGNVEDQMKASLTLTAGIVFLLTGSSIFISKLFLNWAEWQCHRFSGACGIAGVSSFANLIVQSFRFVTYTDEGFGVVGGLSVAGLMGAPPPRYYHTRTTSTFSFRRMTFSLDSLGSLQVHVWPRPFCGMDRWSHVGRRGCHDVLGMPCNGTGNKATVRFFLWKYFCIFLLNKSKIRNQSVVFTWTGVATSCFTSGMTEWPTSPPRVPSTRHGPATTLAKLRVYPEDHPAKKWTTCRFGYCD